METLFCYVWCFSTFQFATLQSQTRLCGRSTHSHVCSNVSVTARTFSRQVNVYTFIHCVSENQHTQAFRADATFIHEAPGHQFVSFPPVIRLIPVRYEPNEGGVVRKLQKFDRRMTGGAAVGVPKGLQNKGTVLLPNSHLIIPVLNAII